jgi:hypothetical protein
MIAETNPEDAMVLLQEQRHPEVPKDSVRDLYFQYEITDEREVKTHNNVLLPVLPVNNCVNGLLPNCS